MNIATKAYQKFENRMIDIIGLAGFGGGMVLGDWIVKIIQNWSYGSFCPFILMAALSIDLAFEQSKFLRRVYDQFDQSGQNTQPIEFKTPTSCCMTFFGVLFAMGIMGAVIIRATNNFRNTITAWLVLGGFYLAIVVGLILLFRSAKKNRFKIFQDTADS